MIGNGYQLTKAFYAEVSQNEPMQMGMTGNHHSLYVWICELRNQLQREIMDLPIRHTMLMSFIGSPTTLMKCIDDLGKWGILEVLQRGTNQYKPTKARIAVSFLERHCNSTDTASIQQWNSTDIALKQTKTVKTDKTSKPKKQEVFDLFWDSYGKKTGKVNTQREWNKLPESDQQLAIDALTRYKAFRPDATFRKDPERYLKDRLWESEFDLPDRPGERVPVNGHTLVPTPKPEFSDR